MTRRPSSFKQRDVTAAIKAAFAAGAVRARVEIGGAIITADKVVSGEPAADSNPWDADTEALRQ